MQTRTTKKMASVVPIVLALSLIAGTVWSAAAGAADATPPSNPSTAFPAQRDHQAAATPLLTPTSSARATPGAAVSAVNPPRPLAACTGGGSSVNYRPNGRTPLHPNGTLIKAANDPTAYVILNGQKRAITSATVLSNLYPNGGFTFNDLITVAADEFNFYPRGADVNGTLPGNGRGQPDGRLIQASGGSEVSIVSNNGTRRPFSGGATLQNLGFQFCAVVAVSAAEYNSYPAGLAVGDSPSLNTPASGSTGVSLTPTFAWGAVANATSYRIMVSQEATSLPGDPSVTTCAGCAINTTRTSSPFTPAAGVLRANTRYFWQVQARSTTDLNIWSAVSSFTTTTTPAAIRIDTTTLNFTQATQGPAAIAPAAPNVGINGGGDKPSDESRRDAGVPSGAREKVMGRSVTVAESATVNILELSRREALNPPERRAKGVHQPVGEAGSKPPKGTPTIQATSDTPQFASPQSNAPSPPAARSFGALVDNGTTFPPDTNGAVGPAHLVAMHNSEVKFQNRNGGELARTSLAGFWSNVLPVSGDVFDPRISYDPYGNRWIATAASDRRSGNSSVLVGVSQTSDPTGNWNLRRIDADPSDQFWADYPSLGFNKNWIAVSVNMFTMSDSQGNTNLFVVNKGDLYANGNPAPKVFTFAASTMVPATTYDNALDPLYIVDRFTNNDGAGQAKLRVSSITGPGNEVLNTGVAFPTTTNLWEGGGGDIAPQLGSDKKINTVDDRMQSVVYRNGSLWCAHTVFLRSAGVQRSAAQWWEVTPGGVVKQFGRVDDPTGNVFYAFPSITANKNNDVLVGYSRFSASQYASANYSFRAASDAPGTLRADALLKDGEAPYFKFFNGNRWGDYSNTVVDPLNDTDLWTIQEYADAGPSGSGRWATWWGQIRPAEVLPTQFKVFTIHNDGGSTLRVTGITKQNNSAWLGIDPSTAPPFDVAPNSFANVAVLVNATGLGAGSYSDRLLVASSDTARSPYPNGVFVNLSVTRPCPTVAGIDPDSGAAGSLVVISGSNLSGVTSVKFAGGVTAGFSVDSDAEITATVPIGAATGPITLGSGCGSAQTPIYTVLAGHTVSGQVLANGAPLKDVQITLTGNQTNTAMTGTDGRYSFPGLPTGNYTVTPSLANYSFTPPSISLNSLSMDQTADFMAAAINEPRIDAISPRAGRAGGGQQIRLTGQLAGISAVTVGGVAATWSYTNGTSEITLTTPAHAAGPVSIDLSLTSGGVYTKPSAFAYLPTSFTDNTLAAFLTQVKAQHIVELRQAVDSLRAVAGLQPAPWTDLALQPSLATVKAEHIRELRSYLDEAASRLGYPPTGYTDPGLGGGFWIRRVHVEELRGRIRSIAGLDRL